jgi:hypothetical protein
MVYLGLKQPEVMPLKLPMQVFCACTGELNAFDAFDRVFVGAEDGYVYEMERGATFDGAAVPAYLQLAWNSLQAPTSNKRFHKVTFEFDAPTAATIGVGFKIDYNVPDTLGAANANYELAQGDRQDRPIAYLGDINWAQPDMGVLGVYMNGLGRNVALTVVSNGAPSSHVLTAASLNFTPRGLER